MALILKNATMVEYGNLNGFDFAGGGISVGGEVLAFSFRASAAACFLFSLYSAFFMLIFKIIGTKMLMGNNKKSMPAWMYRARRNSSPVSWTP